MLLTPRSPADHDLNAPAPNGTAAVRLLRVDIFHKLLDDILSCRLAPGRELREAELAKRFAVSKSPVHDALFRLVQEGLVIVMPRQGYRVAPISTRDVREMFQYRGVLEAGCVRIAAESATDAQLRDLDRFRCFDPQQYACGFIGYNREFHHAVTQLAGNARLQRASQNQIDQMDRVITTSLNAMRGRDPTRLVKQHCDIIDALQARDGRKAARLVSRHIEEAQKRVCEALLRLSIVDDADISQQNALEIFDA